MRIAQRAACPSLFPVSINKAQALEVRGARMAQSTAQAVHEPTSSSPSASGA
jgi:hypothetical protein